MSFTLISPDATSLWVHRDLQILSSFFQPPSYKPMAHEFNHFLANIWSPLVPLPPHLPQMSLSCSPGKPQSWLSQHVCLLHAIPWAAELCSKSEIWVKCFALKIIAVIPLWALQSAWCICCPSLLTSLLPTLRWLFHDFPFAQSFPTPPSHMLSWYSPLKLAEERQAIPWRCSQLLNRSGSLPSFMTLLYPSTSLRKRAPWS